MNKRKKTIQKPQLDPLRYRRRAIERIHGQPNLLEEELPRTLILSRNEWSLPVASQNQHNACSLHANGLQLFERHVPFAVQFLALDKHDSSMTDG